MAFKLVSVFALALLIQTITAQIIANAGCNSGLSSLSYGNLGLGYNSYSNNNANANNLANLNSGGGFVVTSTSPISPSGISVLAENLLIEGPLNVAGQLPLLATVGLEASLPTTGQASTTYSCGNGQVGITSQLGADNANSGSYGANVGANLGAASGLSNYGAIGYGANLGGNCAGSRVY